MICLLLSIESSLWRFLWKAVGYSILVFANTSNNITCILALGAIGSLEFTGLPVWRKSVAVHWKVQKKGFFESVENCNGCSARYCKQRNSLVCRWPYSSILNLWVPCAGSCLWPIIIYWANGGGACGGHCRPTRSRESHTLWSAFINWKFSNCSPNCLEKRAHSFFFSYRSTHLPSTGD